MKYNPSETRRRIKELRRENGITQEEFADRLCITDSYLTKRLIPALLWRPFKSIIVPF
jgi:transcriptional regulator with XRE-family HTH domain